MLDDFVRRQEIRHEVCKNGRTKQLKTPRIEDWTDERRKAQIGLFITLLYQRQYFPCPPPIFAAFRGTQVVGYAIWGSKGEQDFALLSELYVSADCRRMGLGRQLFQMCAGAARRDNANRLLIRADAAAETQAFYRSMGCVPAHKSLQKNIFMPKSNLLLEISLDKSV